MSAAPENWPPDGIRKLTPSRDPGSSRVGEEVEVRRIEVVADLAWVRVLCDGRAVADHERVWARHRTVSDPEHLAAATLLRQQRAVLHPVAAPNVEIGSLGDYDNAVGVDGGVD